MTDREKIISAIEKAKNQSNEYGLDCILVDFKAADMILKLLTEQEPVKPILSVKDRCYYCGNCDETEVKTYDHYCPRCGRKVKWE